MLDYIDKKYSMRKTFMCGAMEPVSLLFDQPTYEYKSKTVGTANAGGNSELQNTGQNLVGG